MSLRPVDVVPLAPTPRRRLGYLYMAIQTGRGTNCESAIKVLAEAASSQPPPTTWAPTPVGGYTVCPLEPTGDVPRMARQWGAEPRMLG